VAGRKPNSRIARHRDHRRRLPFANAFISAVTAGASTAPVIRISAAGRKLDLNHVGSLGHRRRRCRFRLRRDCDRIERHRNRNLDPLTLLLAPAKQLAGVDPAVRATSEATAPGSMAAATIRSFSARDQLRRRCTDVITSTCVLVIRVVLGLLLGLARMTQLRKAVLTGRLSARRILRGSVHDSPVLPAEGPAAAISN
jgi:hypothetical protein